MSAEQSTKELDDLAIHTVLDEVHDAYDEISDNDEAAESLHQARSRIGSDAQQIRYLSAATLDEQRTYALELAARLVRYVELVDIEKAES